MAGRTTPSSRRRSGNREYAEVAEIAQRTRRGSEWSEPQDWRSSRWSNTALPLRTLRDLRDLCVLALSGASREPHGTQNRQRRHPGGSRGRDRGQGAGLCAADAVRRRSRLVADEPDAGRDAAGGADQLLGAVPGRDQGLAPALAADGLLDLPDR